MKVLLENWQRFLSEAQQSGDYTLISRKDGKIVLVHKDTFAHIGSHGQPGAGSVFSGEVTPDMIVDFVENEAAIAPTGGFVKANFPGGGYELVKPMSWVREYLPGASYEAGHKEEFDPATKKKIKIPVVRAITTKTINDPFFAADETSVGIFKYDPGRSTPDQNEFVSKTPALRSAHEEGKLFALATAFPGGFEVEGEKVPRASEWGGADPESAKWAVIIPRGK
jgi:hypothetical protein